MAESGTPADRQERRADTGKSSGETYRGTLRQMKPGCAVELVRPSDEGALPLSRDEIARYDAVFITGSPIHVYEDSPAVDRQLAFMRAVFASGTPSFGSCAGLQVAVAAAGGTVRRMPERLEAGISRRITATAAGRDHPLLAGRPAAWDAPALHADEVERLPDQAILLAGNAVTPIQAAEVRHDRGIFWGVQYHPELSLAEIAAALRRESEALVKADLARSEREVDEQADLYDALDREPESRALQWRLGVDDELAIEERRRLEITNFLAAIPSLDRRA
ncbi:MAG: type 1 glutamine amidotransferase [Erythrobacter sp.]|nr:type 1 glutamine amidotransferase [Erythrobacter sp.]